MTRRINFGLVLLLALLTVPACGRGGPPDPSAVHDVSVTVSLPAGAAPGTITLSTPYGAGPVTGGSGKAGVTGLGATLATAQRGSDLLLMGFVSDERTTLSVRTTAEAFAFYALQGQFLEPAMQASLIDYLSRSSAVGPVAEAVLAAVLASPPRVSADDPDIDAALQAMLAVFAPETTSSGFELTPANLTISPDYQASGVFVRETAPLNDAINVYNAFRRPVFVYVDRVSPNPGAVTSFDLEGAAIEQPATASTFQALTGFPTGDVPRSAIKSGDVAVPGQEDETTIYTVTVVGPGGDPLSSVAPSDQAQKAKELAMRTAIERFLAPTIASALEAGAKQRTAADLGPILQGLSNGTVQAIESGDFATGINGAFADLFNSSALPTTVERVLAVYYPNVRTRDSLQNMRERLTRSLRSLLGATARSVSTNGSGIIGTITASKRIETFKIVSKPVSLRLTPAESTIGKGGEVVVTATIKLPEGADPATIAYRYTLTGALAGYATDSGTDKAFPFTTNSTTITYEHRDTINVVYGTDTVTVEAVQNQNGTEAVIARASATVTVKESTITLTPKSSELGFGEEQTLTATVDPMPTSGTLSYVFVTYGKSTFVGGEQTKVGPSDTVVFRESDTEDGAVQTVNVTVVVDDAGTKTILGEARASVTYVERNDYVLAGNAEGTAGIGVDDSLKVTLNGKVIYDDAGAAAGTRGPIAFVAKQGDSLVFEVTDSYGYCSGLGQVYLVKGKRSAVADPGFDLGCGRPTGNQGVVHTHTFTIPF
ncbi:MAG: hypothetical protein KF813_00115 [Trueperaceae bacterium]|nr:hypothetical protein [Trueperaceae bacterium]